MKQKFPYQLVEGDKIQDKGTLKTVEGVRMLENKVCKVIFQDKSFALIPYIRVVETVEPKKEKSNV